MSKSSAFLLMFLASSSALAQTPAPPAGGSPPPPPAPPSMSSSGIGSSGETALAENSSLNPPMIGDLGRRGFRRVGRTILVPTTTTITVPVTTFVPTTTTTVEDFRDPTGNTGQVTVVTVVTNNTPVTTQQSQQVTTQTPQTTFFRLPLVAPSLKIAENESPRPLDRVYLGYNFYDNLAGLGAPALDVHRETIGFEATFLDGNASIGFRVPVIQQGQGPVADLDGFGAISAIFKVAVVNDLQTGNVFSGGLQVTVPTGRRIFLSDGNALNTVFFQPWVGGIYNFGNAFVHGFTSLVLPTDPRDVAFVSNDIGLSYRVYQGPGFVSSVTPTVEAHIFTPINNRGKDELVQAFHDAVVTAGAITGFANNRVLVTTAVAFSVVGPKQFDAEWIAQLNWRW